MKQFFLSALMLSLSYAFAFAQLGQFRFDCTTGDSVRVLSMAAGPEDGLYVLSLIDNRFDNPSDNTNDAVVLRLNANNEQEWSKTYDPGTFQSITDIAEADDGGFVISGTSTTSYFDGFVAKANMDGDLEWSSFPGDPDLLERGYSGLPTSDGGVLFAGSHAVLVQNALYLVKYDADGFVEWGQYYPVADFGLNGIDVAEVPAGGYLVTGNIGAGSVNNPFVVRLNEQGEQLWANTYNYEDYPGTGLRVETLEDGTFMLLHDSSLDDNVFSGPQGAIVSRINLDGSVVWSRAAQLNEGPVTINFNGINLSFRGVAEGLEATADGNLIFAAGTDLDNSGDIRPVLVKISLDGEMIWGLELEEEGFLVGPFGFGGSPLAVTSGGNYAFAYEDMFDREGFQIVKVDPDGNGVCADPVPDDFFFPVTLNVAPLTLEGVSLTTTSNFQVNEIDQDFSSSTVNGAFNLNLGNDTVLCDGTTLILDPALDSMAAYLWQDGSTDSTFTVMASGVYSVTVTQGDCTAEDSIRVLTPEEAVALGPDLETCAGVPVEIGPAFPVSGDYLWNTGETTPQITVDVEGFYALDLTTACGTVSDLIELNVLTPAVFEIDVTPPSCGLENGSIGITLTGEDPPIALEWFDADGNLIAEDVLFLEGLGDGVYDFVVTIGEDCFISSSIPVESLDAPQVDLTVSPPDCQGDANGLISLNVEGGNPPYQYEWAQNGVPINENGAMINGLAPGLYAYTVTDASGCSVTQEGIALPDVPPINFELDTTDPTCPGEATGAIAIPGLSGGSTAPYQFSLNNGTAQSEPVFAGLESGTYQITIENNNGCDTTVSVTLLESVALSLELIADPNPALFGDSISLRLLTSPFIDPSEATIQWSLDTGTVLSCYDCFEPNLLATGAIDIDATVTLNGGCSYSTTLFLLVEGIRRVYIPNAFSPNEDGINDRFEIFPGPGAAEVFNFRIYNRWGGLVFEASEGEQTWDGTFRGENAPTGVYGYMFQIRWADGFTTLYEGDLQLLR
ncbi:MAG: gliding motility-associated C-terminal domain-containing protein [Mameliella sp.]|nr:gliding motility-associated C-terminal domain-containing protein [Phaeodactylibacter sp.]